MRKKALAYPSMVLWIVTALIATPTRAQEGNSPFEPASVGVRLSGIVECGEGYTSHELYNMNITLLEVVRGDDAWERLRKADSANKPADPGFDYILARVKFEYYARGTPGLCVHEITPQQFTAFSADGVDYPAANVSPPKPEMRGKLRSGESLEGWVAVLVPQTDPKPLLNYSADVGGAILHGGGKWFKLY
jgi:hypothetical protein